MRQRKSISKSNIATNRLSLNVHNREKYSLICVEENLGSSLDLPTIKFCNLDKFTFLIQVFFFYSKLRAWISWFPNTFPTCKFVYARNSGTRAWEIAQWLREVTTLSRDWSSVSRTQVWAHRYLQYIFNWSDAHSEYLWHLHTWTHIHMHTWTCAHTYKMQFFQKNVNN